MRIAYLSNRFPSAVEPYFEAEIMELRSRGVEVVACSILRPTGNEKQVRPPHSDVVTYLGPFTLWGSILAISILIKHLGTLRPFLHRALVEGPEPWGKRLRTLFHTCMGVYLALLLRKRAVEHIHVHHGYFGAWVAMVAARILNIDYSMTLHGSDLLVRGDYLDMKLGHCKFCITISEFNRRYILDHYPQTPAKKILVQRMGVFCSAERPPSPPRGIASCFHLLAVGRLHPVKDHALLVEACRKLNDRGTEFVCRIAGDGPERTRLTEQIREQALESRVQLLGELSRAEVQSAYAWADLVVLTSKSEGIPLTLMEAMAIGKPVLAPRITGIPELVIDGQNGFLYHAGSVEDFVERIVMVRDLHGALGPVCDAAWRHVFHNFNQPTNLAAFCDAFLSRLEDLDGEHCENPLLQQVQLPI